MNAPNIPSKTTIKIASISKSLNEVAFPLSGCLLCDDTATTDVGDNEIVGIDLGVAVVMGVAVGVVTECVGLN